MVKTRIEDPVDIKVDNGDLKFKYMVGYPSGLIKQFIQYNVPYYVRETAFSISVILDDTEYFFCVDNEISKHLYLTRLVKKDFEKWVADGNKVDEKIFIYPKMNTNKNFDHKRKTRKYDINHAFWRIAYIEGMISENTYNHGLRIKATDEVMAKMYCIALSCRGSDRIFDKFKGTKRVKGSVIFNEKTEFRKMYEFIRQKTSYHMDMLWHKLGDEFKSYDTDCIEFADTKKNCTFVSDYFKEHKLSFKIAK